MGFNWGAGSLERVRGLERWCYAAAAVLSFVYVAVVCALPEQITLVFVPAADAAFLEEAVFALRVFAVSYLVRWISYATDRKSVV